MSDDKPIYEFHYPRFSNFLFGTFLCGFAVLPSFVEYTTILPEFIMFLLRGGCLIGGLYCFRRVLRKKPVMTITQDGIFHSTQMRRATPWSEIESIGFESETGEDCTEVSYFRLSLKNSEMYRRPKPALIEAFAILCRGGKVPPIEIYANEFREDAEEVYKVLVAFGPDLPSEAHEKLGPESQKEENFDWWGIIIWVVFAALFFWPILD